VTTVVLVHGAWHGAWCWERVVPALGDAGIPAVAVDLPGHGADGGGHADLHGDAARVHQVLDAIDDDVVLVGHSYGGAVVTEAGVHPGVRHLVFVCAFNVTEEESCQRAARDEVAAAGISHEGRPSLGDAMTVLDDGTAVLTRAGAVECLYQDCSPADAEWAVARLDAQPLVNLDQAPGAVAWRTVRSTYAVCEDDMTVHPGLQRLLAARCTETVTWPTGHSPFLARPDLVVDFLTRVAADGR
jgi:pimeloyl-ACP methyl ester carboxylesterase